MTKEDIDDIINIICPKDEDFEKPCISPAYLKKELEALALEQEPCEDAVSREDALMALTGEWTELTDEMIQMIRIFIRRIKKLPPVNPQPKTGHCKECRYFEYDSVAKVDGIPLIVAHEICSKWGDGCKTSEDGYCFLFEPKKDKEK